MREGLIDIFERKQTSNGVYFNRITDKRFKVNQFSVYFFTDYDELPRADYAAAAYIMTDCCKKFPSYSALSRHLSDLYDASLTSATTFGQSDKRLTMLRSVVLDNRYALNGEDLEAEMCNLLGECILSPNAENGAFDEGVTALMKAELIDTIDSVINDKSAYAMQNANKTAFVGEPMELSPNGTHEQAELVTARSAYEAFRRIPERGRVEIFAAGSGDFAAAEEILTGLFTKVPRNKICELSVRPSVLKSKPVYVSDKLPMQQAILRMYFKAPEFTDRYALSMLAMILGGMTTSRFFMNIREKQSLCYYCACTSHRSKRVLTAYAGVEPQNLGRTEEAILSEIEDIRQNGVTDEELKTARLEIGNQISTLYDSATALIGWHINQIADEKILSPEEYRAEVSKVDPARIQAAARALALDTVYTLSGEDN